MLIPARYSLAENAPSGSRASAFKGTNFAGVTSRDVRIAGENRQMLSSVKVNSSSKKNLVGSNVSFRREEQGSHISSSFSSSSSPSQTERMNVQGNRQRGVAIHTTYQNPNLLYKITDGVDSFVASYENLKSQVVVDPLRHVANIRRGDLNNSGEAALKAYSTLIQKAKPGAGDHGQPASRRKVVTSNRNFVRLRPAISNSRFNQVVKSQVKNPLSKSDVALNPRDWTKLKANDDIRFAASGTEELTKGSHLTQTSAKKKLDSGEQTTQATSNYHSAGAQKVPSQSVRVGDQNSTRDEFDSGIPTHDPKNWPNGALQDIEDLYNYEKYTASLVETNEDTDADQAAASILSSHGAYINHTDPVLDSSVKKIIQWLKIPPIVPNNTRFPVNQHDSVHKPIESVLESIYENLEPNRPLNVEVHDGSYGTVVLQNAVTSQDFDRIDYHNYPNRRPSPSTSVVRPQYATTPSSTPDTLLSNSWSELTLPKHNSIVYNPTTHVSQNTVVHILNDGLKKPNVTVTQLKVPESSDASVLTDQAVSSDSSSEETPSEMVQRPNVHIMFTSQKDEDETPPKQETNAFPSPSDNSNCPTIMINSYTRVNNTIQSKEGCTDLNIIINSHVLNTNVFKPSGEPTETQQQTSVATQSYSDTDESNKYVEEVADDLSHQDSSNSYVTASADTYGSSGSFQSPYPVVQGDYYDSQKDPVGISSHNPISPELSTVEVFQGTQISVSAPYIPLKDTEATAGPVVDGAADAVGSSVDGPSVGDDASSSALLPPAVGVGDIASGASASGSPAGNAPAAGNVPVVALPSSLNEPGTAMGLANNGLVPSGTLQLPSLPSLPSRPSRPSVGGKPSLSSSGGASHGSAGSSSHHDDDDDDDDFDMTPGGLMQSMTSVFTYFTFLNPLGYSFFSLAAAPFAAMAAGVLGVAAFIFPWAFPSAFDFGRAADKVTVRFRPSLEEFVRQAVHKYDRLNEWKSKRRKRRRCGQLNNTKRDLKDLQYMDQSLRTVATQLLNVTSPEDIVKTSSQELIKAEHGTGTTQKTSEKSDVSLIKEINSEISNLESMGVSFGRPINSKFSYFENKFENSHPGHAMAITEEELEREMSTTRLITAYKNHPTTTGGISTWILLNPPSTTMKSVMEVEKKTKQPFQTEVRLTVRPSSSIERVETIPQLEKITEKTTPQLTSIITTEKITVSTKKPTSTTLKKSTTTLRPEKITQSLEKAETSSSTTLKMVRTTTASATTNDGVTSTTLAPTTKKNQSPRTTPKPKVTSRTTLHPKPTSVTTKPSRPSQQSRPKPNPTKRTTVKPETIKNETASTGKIEKVTFKPVQIITSPKNRPENTERPMFVTKIKASVLMDTQKIPTTLLPAPTATTLSATTTSKSNLSGADLVEVPVRSKPIGTKVNNVLKVQLKKPADETTQIEVEPIKVNAPILKIEKVNKDKLDKIMEKDTDDLANSRIDLKFDFNPELTKINVQTQTEVATTTTTSATTATTPSSTAAATTTKRPRHNSKRKKNKGRRRKPSSTSVAPSSTVASIMSTLIETSESVTDSTVIDNAVQESKIAPETKIATNTTKTKKKQPQKAISTQIYNFLSREVMPSFGVMSLVGLGLGLASYFLYPFGGTISRRNYEVEPNYKYNLEDYDGNYGQSEEEVLSKVFQGMTNHEGKYPGIKDQGNNYYHYQHYDGAYDAQTTKRVDSRYPSVSTSPLYRPAENTQSAVKYRNTDYNRYSEIQTTPVYYDRKHVERLAEVPGSANRQFVVGNVPKEYPFDVKAAVLPIVSKKGNGYESTEGGQTQFERDIAQSFNFPPGSGNVHGYGSAHLSEASTVRTDDGYEEIEITPTAVAVEHGPRSLKVKRAASIDGDGRLSRSKRESVIQVIPSKHELEEEEKEEDLSNEILDIIDLALPGGDDQKTRNSSENNNEVEDLEAQKRKRQEEVNMRAKESTMRTFTTLAQNLENAEGTTRVPESVESTSKTVEETNDDTNKDTTEETHTVNTTSSSSKNAETTTIEWFESSTTQKPTEGFSLFNFVKKVAEIKFRLGLTILKHASEGFARYLGHVQKRINGEE
ncbi:uncharacterized protein LOC116849670 [Odontomachus brunneus]|uniref:uncharacterized protein LOC116849670 n=1 Tax=Odontomachus brunneus TaxID=486640 RepID=UPI0013F29AD3|nr:uncharacterized protein LOC116849670 [Odontomachus brunneus]